MSVYLCEGVCVYVWGVDVCVYRSVCEYVYVWVYCVNVGVMFIRV